MLESIIVPTYRAFTLGSARSECASTFAVNGITTMLASQRKLIQIAPLS